MFSCFQSDGEREREIEMVLRQIKGRVSSEINSIPLIALAVYLLLKLQETLLNLQKREYVNSLLILQ